MKIDIKNNTKPNKPTSPINSIRSEWAWLAKEFDKFGKLNWNIVSKPPAPYPKIKYLYIWFNENFIIWNLIKLTSALDISENSFSKKRNLSIILNEPKYSPNTTISTNTIIKIEFNKFF